MVRGGGDGKVPARTLRLSVDALHAPAASSILLFSNPKNGDKRNHGFHGFHRLHGFSDLRVSAGTATLHPEGEHDSRSKCLVIRIIRAIRGSYFRI